MRSSCHSTLIIKVVDLYNINLCYYRQLVLHLLFSTPFLNSSSSYGRVFSITGSLFRQILILCIQVCHPPLVLCVCIGFLFKHSDKGLSGRRGLPVILVFRVRVFKTMPLKGHGSKAPIKGSSSKTLKGTRNENLPINPPIQTPSIPKTPAKTFIDGIHFNTFSEKFHRNLYIKVYHQRFFFLERQLHLESFLDTPIPIMFVELGWLPLAGFIRTVCAPIVHMFYLNIIKHDLDESHLKSSLFGIVVKVTPKVVVEVLGITLVKAPFMSELEITSKLLDLWGEVRGKIGSVIHTGSISHPARVLATFLTFSVYPSFHRVDICKKCCILLSRIIHRKPINLASCIIDEMIVRGDCFMSKKKVLLYGHVIVELRYKLVKVIQI